MSFSSGFDTYPFAKEMCGEILQLDRCIRFVGIANKMGSLIAYEFTKGLSPLLTEDELRSYTMQTVLRMMTREEYESKLGDVIYTFSLYKKVKRAAIPLPHNSIFSVLTISFDMACQHEIIIMDKILPYLKNKNMPTESQ
jgi:hypothetical protein